MAYDPIDIAIEGERFLQEMGLKPQAIYMGTHAYAMIRKCSVAMLKGDPRLQWSSVLGIPLYVKDDLDPWAVTVSPDPPPTAHAQDDYQNRPASGAGVRPRNQRVPTPGPVPDPLLGDPWDD